MENIKLSCEVAGDEVLVELKRVVWDGAGCASDHDGAPLVEWADERKVGLAISVWKFSDEAFQAYVLLWLDAEGIKIEEGCCEATSIQDAVKGAFRRLDGSDRERPYFRALSYRDTLRIRHVALNLRQFAMKNDGDDGERLQA